MSFRYDVLYGADVRPQFAGRIVEEKMLSKLLPSSLIRKLGGKVVGAALVGVADGKYGVLLKDVYWQLRGHKTLVGLLLAVGAVVGYLTGHATWVAYLSSASAAMVSVGLADKVLHADTPEWTQSWLYRFLLPLSQNIGTVLTVIFGYVYGVECKDLTIAGHLLTCLTMRDITLAFAGVLIFTGVLDQAALADAPIPPDDRAKLEDVSKYGAPLVALLGLALLSAGCASGSVSMFKADHYEHPSAKTVMQYVCVGQDSAAVRYLSLNQFQWMGEALRETYLADALMDKAKGKCPCAVNKTCVTTLATPTPTPQPSPE